MPRQRTITHPINGDREPTRIVPTLTEPRFSQSLERGLAILECFTPERPIWGIAELANELGMSNSTTHRYVLTLTALGYLTQNTKKKYRLTLKVTDLGMSALNSTSLREHARPHLEDLRRRTRFTVALAVLDGPQVLLIDRLRGNRLGQQLIELDQADGSTLPVHSTALGKLLLAYLPEQEQRCVIAEMTLTRHTSRTITRKNALRAELRSVREPTLVAAEEEFAPGLYSIATPLRSDSRETVAAISMDAHSSMIPLADMVNALGPHLISTADSISARLGYRRDDELPTRPPHAWTR